MDLLKIRGIRNEMKFSTAALINRRFVRRPCVAIMKMPSCFSLGLDKKVIYTVKAEIIHFHTKFGIFCIVLFEDQFHCG